MMPGVGEPVAASQAATILELRNVEVVYNDVILVLRGVSLVVPDGARWSRCSVPTAPARPPRCAPSPTCSSSTTPRSPRARSRFAGERIDGLDPAAIVRKGVSQVMEGRRVFAELSVDDNLKAGALHATRPGRSASRTTG